MHVALGVLLQVTHETVCTAYEAVEAVVERGVVEEKTCGIVLATELLGYHLKLSRRLLKAEHQRVKAHRGELTGEVRKVGAHAPDVVEDGAKAAARAVQPCHHAVQLLRRSTQPVEHAVDALVVEQGVQTLQRVGDRGHHPCDGGEDLLRDGG